MVKFVQKFLFTYFLGKLNITLIKLDCMASNKKYVMICFIIFNKSTSCRSKVTETMPVNYF